MFRTRLSQTQIKVITNQITIILIYLIILPIVQSYCIELNISKAITNFDIIHKIMPFLVISFITICIINRSIGGMVAVLPAVFYLNLLPDDLIYYRQIIIGLIAVSFLYTAIIGHIRSFSFLFLIVYSSIISDWYIVAIMTISFMFARFVVLAFSHNYTIFLTLGLKKSIQYLARSFLYWSPLLLIIIPINQIQTQINNKITQEIYSFTPVDTIQYHQFDNLQDTTIGNFKADSNTSSVLFIDNARNIRNRDTRTDYPFSLPILKTTKTAIKEIGNKELSHEENSKELPSSDIGKDHLPQMNGLQKDLISARFNRHKTIPNNPIFNNIDMSLSEQNDTSMYETLKKWIPENKIGIDEVRSIFVNELVLDDYSDNSNRKFSKRNILTSITNTDQADSSIILILKNISLPNPNFINKSLQGNIEVSSTHLFLSFRNKLLRKIKQETGNIDFSSINHLNGKLSHKILGAKQEGTKLIDTQKKKVFKQINEHENTTMLTVDKEFNAIFPEPLLKIEEAKFWEIKKLIANAIKKSVNQKYQVEKRKLKRKIDLKIRSVYSRVRNKTDHVFMSIEQQYANATSAFQVENIDTGEPIGTTINIPQMIEDSIKGAVSEVNETTITTIRITFTILFFYWLLGTLSFAYLVMQTFLYVFARVTISEKNNVFATLNTSIKELPQGSIKACGDTYTIPADNNEVYYVSRDFEPSGMPPNFVIPYPTTSILPRIKSQVYFMNRIKIKNKNPVEFRAVGSCEFVEWTLAQGEEVVFNYQNLVAFTNTVKLKSLVNLRVTTLILGKIFHKVAVGPGKIILMTKGRPVISGEASANTSLAQNRILAWNGGARFDIDSELNLVDIYLSGFYLKKTGDDLIVVDADAKAKASSGLIQYVKGLIWPF